MKPDILLEAKLQSPRLVRDYVERTALVEKLKQCRERLVVFHANMGFGKTMFMSQYALQSGCPFLWYHLDRQDNDASVFLGYLREGIRQKFGEDGKKAAEGILDGQTAAAVLNRLNSAEGGNDFNLFLLLDDFQEIENEEIYELLDAIFKNTGNGIRFLLTTKGPIPRFVNRYVLEETAVVLKTEDLAFSRAETFRLLSCGRTGAVDTDVAEAIYKYTEGWPAGVMFLHLYQKQGRILAGRDQMLKICQEYLVHDYIMYELFRKLPFDLQEFLKKSSVLEYLDSRVCNAVAQIRNSSGQLRYLIQENMFIQKTEGNFEVYRYHSMFRDFLKSQLTEEEQVELCGRAAVYYLGNGQSQQALEYALMANSRAMVKAVLERSGFELLAERRYMLLSEALDWCRLSGDAASEHGRALELLLRIYTDQDLAEAERAVLEEIRNWDHGHADRRLYETLITMSAEFYCEKGMDGMADRILETALEQEGITAIKWFEYLAARIYFQIRLGRVHRAGILYQAMSKKSPAGLPALGREQKKMKEIRRTALELSEPWTASSGAESEENEERWWMSEKECLLLKQLRFCRDGWTEMESGTLEGDLENPPEWMAAFGDVYRGMVMFDGGDRAGGHKLVWEGIGRLKKYPWLSWPSGWLDRRRCSWLYMLEEAGNTESFPFHMFVKCFGRFGMTVMETGENIRFRTHKAKECMAYLYFMKQPVSREQIIAALWGDVDELPSNEVAALHNIFSSLRKSLSPYGLENLICYEDKKYFLKSGCLFSDVERVEAFLHAADVKDQEAMLEASGICWLYEGPFLEDIDGVWCVGDRAYFERKLGGAFFELARVYKKERDYEACLRLLSMSETINMIREPVNLCKMDCFIEQKDGNMLKKYYHQLKKHYLDITGEEPGEVVRKRYQDGMKICGKQ